MNVKEEILQRTNRGGDIFVIKIRLRVNKI